MGRLEVGGGGRKVWDRERESLRGERMYMIFWEAFTKDLNAGTYRVNLSLPCGVNCAVHSLPPWLRPALYNTIIVLSMLLTKVLQKLTK